MNEPPPPAKALAEKVQLRKPAIGAAIGSGLTAMAAESGGADFLMVLSAGHFRIQGCSSMAALLPYADSNNLTWRITETHVMPRVTRTPVFQGLLAQDPNLNPPVHLERCRNIGLAGVTNFPSVGFIDGNYRRALEESGLGFEREVAMLRAAKASGLMTIGFVFTADEARAMTEADADMLCLDLGFAEWRSLSEEAHDEAMDDAILRVNEIIHAVKRTNPRPYVVIFGGPVGTPRDFAAICEHADVQGYVGGSTFERFPALPVIAQTLREFKSVVKSGPRLNRLGAMVGHSDVMQRVFETLSRAADTDAPVLITGESGTGKELAARELYRLSLRHTRPMVSWNCGALTETLAMSELFGHEKGAFTGAATRHIGRFEQAHEGTLFMDEVADLPLSVQASLLRVIQEQEFIRVGGREVIRADVRLIAATNKNLIELVRDGQFRLDLFYRLNTIVVHIPPLRERKEDIPFLVRELVQEYSQRYGYPTPEVPAQVLNALMRHAWPGNIRELQNAVERCVILGRGEQFQQEWLEDFFQMARALDMEPPHPLPHTRDYAKARAQLHEVLAQNNNNKAATARALGITRKTLYTWLAEAETGQSPSCDGISST